jgi:hypothetical protein
LKTRTVSDVLESTKVLCEEVAQARCPADRQHLELPSLPRSFVQQHCPTTLCLMSCLRSHCLNLIYSPRRPGVLQKQDDKAYRCPRKSTSPVLQRYTAYSALCILADLIDAPLLSPKALRIWYPTKLRFDLRSAAFADLQ